MNEDDRKKTERVISSLNTLLINLNGIALDCGGVGLNVLYDRIEEISNGIRYEISMLNCMVKEKHGKN